MKIILDFGRDITNHFFFSDYKIVCGKKFEFIMSNKFENFILSSSFYENEIFLWSLIKNKVIYAGKNELKEFIVSLKGQFEDIFTVGTHTGSVYIYTMGGALIGSYKKKNSNSNFRSVDIQKSVTWWNENIFFSGKSSGKIDLFDRRINKGMNFVQGHSSEISVMDCSSEKKKPNPFFLGSLDILGNLKLWDIRNGKDIFFGKKSSSRITSMSFL